MFLLSVQEMGRRSPQERHVGLCLLAAYNQELWAMIEFLVFTFRKLALWEVIGYHGLGSLDVTRTADGLGLPQQDSPGAPFALFSLRKGSP